MLAAVENGDVKKVAELLKHNPGFKVNMRLDEHEWTLVHHACLANHRSAVIPLLLAHPDIDVNSRSENGSTPFFFACLDGTTSCVREMLKDPRVKVNAPDYDGKTPLWYVANWGHLDIIKWWITSGRKIDLGKPGKRVPDVIGTAKRNGRTEVVSLLERFKENPRETRQAMRAEIGWYDELAAEMFAMVVFVSDGLLQVAQGHSTSKPAARFFSIVRGLPFFKSNPKPLDVGSQRFFRIAAQLPLELQMVLCHRLVGSIKENISGRNSEMAFKWLAKRICEPGPPSIRLSFIH